MAPNNNLQDRPIPDSTIEGTSDRLRTFKATLDRAIRGYPTPIAGCDEQFNQLLEHRELALYYLQRLDDLRQDGTAPDHAIREAANFMETSAFGKKSTGTSDTNGH